MGPGYFVLAIMGCGDAGTMCDDIAQRETMYRSEAACIADTEDALEEAAMAPYPVVMAQCRPATQRVAEADSRASGWMTP